MNEKDFTFIKREIGYFATLEQKRELRKWLQADLEDSEDFETEKDAAEMLNNSAIPQ